MMDILLPFEAFGFGLVLIVITFIIAAGYVFGLKYLGVKKMISLFIIICLLVGVGIYANDKTCDKRLSLEEWRKTPDFVYPYPQVGQCMHHDLRLLVRGDNNGQ